MDGTERMSPQVHKLLEINTLRDDYYIMVVLPNGEKRKMKAHKLKEYIQKESIDKLKSLEDTMKQFKITKETIIKAFSKSKSVSFGKPFNIALSSGVEKTGKKGDLYVGSKEFRVNIGGKWHTVMLKEDAN
jgi:hypothetical protein